MDLGGAEGVLEDIVGGVYRCEHVVLGAAPIRHPAAADVRPVDAERVGLGRARLERRELVEHRWQHFVRDFDAPDRLFGSVNVLRGHGRHPVTHEANVLVEDVLGFGHISGTGVTVEAQRVCCTRHAGC